MNKKGITDQALVALIIALILLFLGIIISWRAGNLSLPFIG
jgi:hypothetical protein